MRTISIALALFAIVLAGACSDHDTATTANTPATSPSAARGGLSPEELGELGAKIQKNPNDAQRLLSERGLNEQSFEQAVRKVSEDPAAAKRYSDAYKKANA